MPDALTAEGVASAVRALLAEPAPRAAAGQVRAGDRRDVDPAGGRRGSALVAHRPGDMADVEQADLALVDRREGMADERVQPGLVDLDVEDAAAAGRYLRRLHVVQMLRQVGVDPGAVEDRADDVEVGVDARPGIHHPEAHGVAGSAVSGCLTYWPE